MGHPVSIGEALVIESLTQAVRARAFMIPSALGAQEAGLILLCGIFGVPPDQALALSLIKRAADVVVGVPGLVALQILEGGRLAATMRAAKQRAALSRFSFGSMRQHMILYWLSIICALSPCRLRLSRRCGDFD